MNAIRRGGLATVLAAFFLAGINGQLVANGDDDDDDDKKSLAEQLADDVREGKVKFEVDHAAVNELILKRNFPIP